MFEVYKSLGWFFKQEWKKYLVMLLLLIALSFMSIIPARLLGEAIDTIVAGELSKRLLIGFVLLFVLVPLVRYVFDFCYHYLINSQGQKLSYQLRKRYLNKLFEMDSKLYEEYTKGDLIARVTNDLQALTVAATSLLQEIVYNTSLLTFTIGTMILSINLKLTLVSVTIMPISFFILTKILRRMRRYYRTHRKIYSNMTEKVLESVEGVKVVRAYVQEENDRKQLEEAIHEDINSWRKIVKFETIFGPLFDFVYSISYFLAFAYGTYLVIFQEITVGQLITFTMYLGMLYGPIISLSNIFNGINNAIISNERFSEILSKETDVKDTSDSKPIINFNEIEFKDVSFKYPFDKHQVINHINFTINKGEKIGIVGPTGSGKSTLIRQLLREFNVKEGQILIDGLPIEQYQVLHVRNLVGYVPQSHILFRRTVDENILIGKQEAEPNEVETAIRIADFKKDVAYLTDGLNTLVGESGATLSGGQKQRLSIARALIKDPEILILDDSLSAVDADTEKTIINHLKEYRNKKTTIIVAHRFSAIKDADKILVLVDGKIIERGTHEELIALDGWYKEQYIKQTVLGEED
ncbi:ABC transporter ATP-binding protein [Haloplasma contractile]|uniref:Multidrug resistance ABC transporter ATP-binding-permease protein YheI n=1 Tax=Haloplasma contractile SSD-17B TaxID=1033810 RepID=F7Q1H7_9MOLU|nr:ABC transporter ATP-binding protein [Haloplasma contractile]ERJ12902.1 putative multidrug resistance ABC transporter ATP-binding-permease protein YheI [Haloplasma contractile SSD-17B]